MVSSTEAEWEGFEKEQVQDQKQAAGHGQAKLLLFLQASHCSSDYRAAHCPGNPPSLLPSPRSGAEREAEASCWQNPTHAFFQTLWLCLWRGKSSTLWQPPCRGIVTTVFWFGPSTVNEWSGDFQLYQTDVRFYFYQSFAYQELYNLFVWEQGIW